MSQLPPDPYQNPFPHARPAEPLQLGFDEETPTEKPRRRGSVFGVAFAWITIATIGVFMYALNDLDNRREISEGEAKVELQQVNSMAKFAIASANWAGSSEGLADNLNSGPYEHRLCYVLMTSELEGPQKAIEELDQLDNKATNTEYQLNEKQIRLNRIIRNLLLDYQQDNWAADSVSTVDREFLVEELGFSASIGLAPSEGADTTNRQSLLDQAKRSTNLLFALVVFVLLGGIMGMGCFGALGMLLFGKFFGHYVTDNKPWQTFRFFRSHFQEDSLNGRIYAETFALWLICFLGSGLVIGLILAASGIQLNETMAAGLGFVTFLGSLIALIWPTLRGIPFGTMCDDVGLRIGNPFKEVFCGVYAYLANLPIMLVGLICAGQLAALSESMKDAHELEATRQVSHPIVEKIAQGDTLLIVLVILTAVVGAPIVEEVAFRGLLYRHLREATLRWGRILSVAFSVLFNGLIFAAIHPQGWTAIPVLTSLAIGFSWAREWRGSLIAPMTMHAINNGFISIVMLMTLA